MSAPDTGLAGRNAIYEQRKGNRSRFFDAYVETVKANGLVKIQWKDDTGKLHTSNVPSRFVQVVAPDTLL